MGSSGMLRTAQWHFVTDTSGKPVGSLKMGPTACSETPVTNYHSLNGSITMCLYT